MDVLLVDNNALPQSPSAYCEDMIPNQASLALYTRKDRETVIAQIQMAKKDPVGLHSEGETAACLDFLFFLVRFFLFWY